MCALLQCQCKIDRYRSVPEANPHSLLTLYPTSSHRNTRSSWLLWRRKPLPDHSWFWPAPVLEPVPWHQASEQAHCTYKWVPDSYQCYSSDPANTSVCCGSHLWGMWTALTAFFKARRAVCPYRYSYTATVPQYNGYWKTCRGDDSKPVQGGQELPTQTVLVMPCVTWSAVLMLKDVHQVLKTDSSVLIVRGKMSLLRKAKNCIST